jgi:hypothetical protein
MVTLNRTSTSEAGTFGELANDDGSFLCYTVERPYAGDYPCVPLGTYPVNQYNSPTKGDVWMLSDTAPRMAIEIHPANWASELLGCIAVGATIEMIEGVMGVSDSQNTFKMLKSTLPDSFMLTITGVTE